MAQPERRVANKARLVAFRDRIEVLMVAVQLLRT
jgi:hypothetical protein